MQTNNLINQKETELEKNMVFVSTIFDSFEALEETLGKLKLEQPLFLTHIAKRSFAEAVFKQAEKNPQIYALEKESLHRPNVLQ